MRQFCYFELVFCARLWYERGSVNVSVAQWIGSRHSQEDAYAVRHFPEGTLAVVCDGMGGHDCGSLASSTASAAFVAAFEQAQGSVVDRLRSALDAANAEVGLEFARRSLYGGTTLLAVYASGGVVWWVSVGDSLLMLWRRGRLLRLNADHSMRSVYTELVRMGTMDASEAMSQGHALRSAVTGERLSLVDAPPTPYPLLPGDRIIMASDGADALLLPPRLPESLRSLLDSRDSAQKNLSVALVEACEALHLPHADNVTVLSMDWV